MAAYEKFAYTYDRLMRDMPYPMWLRFVKECWQKYGMPQTVVDLGCGTGNLTLPLARMGFSMTGIDLSEDMLAIAAGKSVQSLMVPEGSVRWIHQDMREWLLEQQVDAVISFCDSLNYLLEEEDMLQTFRQTYGGLKENGIYIFDVHTPLQLESYAKDQPFMLDEDDVAYIWTCNLEPSRHEITHELTIFSKADSGSGKGAGIKEDWFERFEETHVQRAYSLDCLRDGLLDSGFKKVELFADFRWAEPDEYTQRAFFVAVK